MKRNETNAFGVKENVPGVDVATLLSRSLSETKQRIVNCVFVVSVL